MEKTAITWRMAFKEPETKKQTEAKVAGFLGRNKQFLRIIQATKGVAESFEEGLTASRDTIPAYIRQNGRLKRQVGKLSANLAGVQMALTDLAFETTDEAMKQKITAIRDKIKDADTRGAMPWIMSCDVEKIGAFVKKAVSETTTPQSQKEKTKR